MGDAVSGKTLLLWRQRYKCGARRHDLSEEFKERVDVVRYNGVFIGIRVFWVICLLVFF